MEIKDYNVIIDGRSFFDQSIKNGLKTYDKLRKIATGQGDYYITGCLLDYPYFKNYYKLIAIALSKQKKLYADPKVIQQINFTGNLDRPVDATLFFIIEQSEETVLNFSKGIIKIL